MKSPRHNPIFLFLNTTLFNNLHNAGLSCFNKELKVSKHKIKMPKYLCKNTCLLLLKISLTFTLLTPKLIKMSLTRSIKSQQHSLKFFKFVSISIKLLTNLILLHHLKSGMKTLFTHSFNRTLLLLSPTTPSKSKINLLKYLKIISTLNHLNFYLTTFLEIFSLYLLIFLLHLKLTKVFSQFWHLS